MLKSKSFNMCLRSKHCQTQEEVIVKEDLHNNSKRICIALFASSLYKKDLFKEGKLMKH